MPANVAGEKRNLPVNAKAGPTTNTMKIAEARERVSFADSAMSRGRIVRTVENIKSMRRYGV